MICLHAEATSPFSVLVSLPAPAPPLAFSTLMLEAQRHVLSALVPAPPAPCSALSFELQLAAGAPRPTVGLLSCVVQSGQLSFAAGAASASAVLPLPLSRMAFAVDFAPSAGPAVLSALVSVAEPAPHSGDLMMAASAAASRALSPSPLASSTTSSSATSPAHSAAPSPSPASPPPLDAETHSLTLYVRRDQPVPDRTPLMRGVDFDYELPLVVPASTGAAQQTLDVRITPEDRLFCLLERHATDTAPHALAVRLSVAMSQLRERSWRKMSNNYATPLQFAAAPQQLTVLRNQQLSYMCLRVDNVDEAVLVLARAEAPLLLCLEHKALPRAGSLSSVSVGSAGSVAAAAAAAGGMATLSVSPAPPSGLGSVESCRESAEGDFLTWLVVPSRELQKSGAGDFFLGAAVPLSEASSGAPDAPARAPVVAYVEACAIATSVTLELGVERLLGSPRRRWAYASVRVAAGAPVRCRFRVAPSAPAQLDVVSRRNAVPMSADGPDCHAAQLTSVAGSLLQHGEIVLHEEGIHFLGFCSRTNSLCAWLGAALV